MPSFQSFACFAVGSALLAHVNFAVAGRPASCPVTSSTQLSCHNTTVQADTCCFNAPGGQLLQTQFWDTNPASGPSNSWTIHGLWPDNCDGTYQAFCDASRAYTNISQIVGAAAPGLLSYMNTYWTSNTGTAESFWEHEWSKHGTCISTFDTACYTNYTPQEEVVDFFNKTVEIFQTLNSYQFLAAAGITPSSTQTYTSADILAALQKGHGAVPAIQCADGALDEIWYFYNTKGSTQTGVFVPAPPDGSKSDCPATGIKYLPKSGSPAPPASTTAASAPPPAATSTTSAAAITSSTAVSGGAFSGKGFLQVSTPSGSNGGCLIGAGRWYIGGTCATFAASPSGSGFTLASAKGPCSLTNGDLSCAAGNTATVFTSSAGKLSYGARTTWFAAGVPSGTTQELVTTSTTSVQISITWKPTGY